MHNSNIQISANDILTKYEEANDNFPLSRQQIIDAMNNYADICITKTHDLLTSADYLLAPVEDLYRDEHPSPCFYIPCRHKLFKWIAEKLTENKTSKEKITFDKYWKRQVSPMFFTKDHSVGSTSFLKGQEYPIYRFHFDIMTQLIREGIISQIKQ